MTNIPFFKYHAIGNDYIVIDPHKAMLEMSEENIKFLCNRHIGIGSDGILYGPIMDNGKVSLRIYNSDGSEAEKSGNGIRIFSKYLFNYNYVDNTKFTIHTKGGDVHVQIVDNEANYIAVDMGIVNFMSNKIPVSGNVREVINEDLLLANGDHYKVSCVSLGNPHCVVIMPDHISPEIVRSVGPLIENHKLFPNKINVQFMKVLDRENIQIEIWERGSGYTLSSGSSSCAAAAIAFKLGLTDNNMTVHMPGGDIRISIMSDDWRIWMSGAVTKVFDGELEGI